MFRRNPCVSSLQLRKELLIAESELNRPQLIEEWQAVAGGVRLLGARAKSFSLFASTAALLMTGVSKLRGGTAATNGTTTSWLDRALKVANVAGSIWMGLRWQKRAHKDK